MIKKLEKYFILFFIMGTVYGLIEYFWRTCISGEKVWDQQTIVMIFIGGLVGVIVGYLNEPKVNKKWMMIIQVLISSLLIVIIELLTGLFVNVFLVYIGIINEAIWYYDRYHLFHQICLTHTFLWFLIAPFAIWIDDFLRHKIFNEEKGKTLIRNYIDLFTFK